MRLKFFQSAIAAALACVPTSMTMAAPPQYELVPLRFEDTAEDPWEFFNPSETFLSPTSGLILGVARDVDGGGNSPVIYDINAGSFTTLEPQIATFLTLRDITDSGAVIALDSFSELRRHPYLAIDKNGDGEILAGTGEITNPENPIPIIPGGAVGLSNAANNSLQIAGALATVGGESSQLEAARWTDLNDNGMYEANEALRLGSLAEGATSLAEGINNHGDVVGTSFTGPDPNTFPLKAIYWRDLNNNGENDPGELIDLGTLGGTSSFAVKINDNRQVLGFSRDANNVQKGFIWEDLNNNHVSDPGEMTVLESLFGPNATVLVSNINSQGDAIGWSFSGSDRVGMLWHDGVAYNIKDLIVNKPDTWRFIFTSDINDKGQILVAAIDSASPFAAERSAGSAFLLNPIPEPSTAMLLGASLMTCLIHRRRV